MIGPVESKLTFAGPRYCIHVTFSPRGRALTDVLLCAPARGLGGAARGFGNPSSVTNAVNVSGAPTLAGRTGSIAIDGGLFGSSSPGFKFPRVMIMRSEISSTGSNCPYAFSVLPCAVTDHTSSFCPQSFGTLHAKHERLPAR